VPLSKCLDRALSRARYGAVAGSGTGARIVAEQGEEAGQGREDLPTAVADRAWCILDPGFHDASASVERPLGTCRAVPPCPPCSAFPDRPATLPSTPLSGLARYSTSFTGALAHNAGGAKLSSGGQGMCEKRPSRAVPPAQQIPDGRRVPARAAARCPLASNWAAICWSVRSGPRRRCQRPTALSGCHSGVATPDRGGPLR